MTREEAIAILRKHHMWTGEPEEIIDVRQENEAVYMAIKALEQEPETGHWTHDGSRWKNRFICSECGYKLFDEPTNYCPNCGAKMEEV